MPRSKRDLTGLRPDRMYFQRELALKHGIAEKTLALARQSGMVVPYDAGQLYLYDGAQLIAFIKTRPITADPTSSNVGPHFQPLEISPCGDKSRQTP